MDDLRLDTNVADYLILVIYFVVVLGIGFAAKRYIKTSLDYFLSGRSLPAWITGLAFISANLGALEILGMAANGATVRRRDRPLLLDRRGPGDGLPRHRDDAVLLRLQGALRAGVPAAALQPADAPVQRAVVRVRDRADRGREPVRAGARARAAAGLADPARHRRRRRDRARLHHARRALLGDLQRGAAVLHHPRGARAAGARRPARRRRLGRAEGGDPHVGQGRRGLPARVGGHRRRQRHEPARGVVDPDRLRPRLRALVRLLDDELRRGPARAVGQVARRRAAHAADRRLPEDLHPVHHGHPRPGRADRDPGPRLGPAEHGGQQRDPAADERVPAERHARARARRA